MPELRMIAKNHSKQGSITIQSFYSDHLNFFVQMLAAWAKISSWMKTMPGLGPVQGFLSLVLQGFSETAVSWETSSSRKAFWKRRPLQTMTMIKSKHMDSINMWHKIRDCFMIKAPLEFDLGLDCKNVNGQSSLRIGRH